MNKSLLRIIALLLAASLIADPVSAAGMASLNRPIAPGCVHSLTFTQQAVTQPALQFWNVIMGHSRRAWVNRTGGIQIMASAGVVALEIDGKVSNPGSSLETIIF